MTEVTHKWDTFDLIDPRIILGVIPSSSFKISMTEYMYLCYVSSSRWSRSMDLLFIKRDLL